MVTPNGSTSGNGNGRNMKASTAYEVASALRAQASRAAQATRDAAARVQEAVRGDDVAVNNEPISAIPRQGGEPSGAEAAMAATSTTYETSQRSQSRDSSPTGAAAAAAAGSAPPQAPAPAPVVRPARPGHRSEVAVEETQASLDARPAASRLPQPIPVPHTSPPSVRRGRVRKARLRLLRVDPWSVMKTAFLLSVALGIAIFVAVAVLWSVLDAAGVFGAVGGLVQDLTQSETGTGVDIESYTSLSRVLGFTTLIAVVDVVLVTALATLGAFLYNLSAGLLGGLEVTLAEDD